MKVLAIALLFVIAVLAGGCSVLSLLVFWTDSFSLSLPGLAVAGLCALLIRKLSKDWPEARTPPQDQEKGD